MERGNFMLGSLPSREEWLFRRSDVAVEGSIESLVEYCAVVPVQSKVKIFIERIQVPFLTLANSFRYLGNTLWKSQSDYAAPPSQPQ